MKDCTLVATLASLLYPPVHALPAVDGSDVDAAVVACPPQIYTPFCVQACACSCVGVTFVCAPSGITCTPANAEPCYYYCNCANG